MGKKDDPVVNKDDSVAKKEEKVTFRNTPGFRLLFIEKCLEQATEAGFSGTSLKSSSWDNLVKFFSEKYDWPFTQKKLKNHWDYLRGQYIIWTRLLARTGHGYNAETKTFEYTDEEWVEIDKSIKKASQFKENPLEDVDLLQSLFDGKFSTGANRDTPGRVEPMPCPAGTSTVSAPESGSRTSGKEQVVLDDTEVESKVRGSGKKRKKAEIDEAEHDLLTEKVCTMVTSIESHLEQKKVALQKNVAEEFMTVLENLQETGYISEDDYYEISLKASELSGWQKLFVSLKSNERRVAFAKKLLEK